MKKELQTEKTFGEKNRNVFFTGRLQQPITDELGSYGLFLLKAAAHGALLGYKRAE